MTRYYDENGDVVYVSPGVADYLWMTVRREPKGTVTHRIVSDQLPVRPDMDSAQAGLDAYALKKGWKPVK